MNAIAMALQQMQPTKGRADKSDQEVPETESSLFQSLLSNEQDLEKMDDLLLEPLLNDIENQTTSDEPITMDEDISEVLQSYLMSLVMDTQRPFVLGNDELQENSVLNTEQVHAIQEQLLTGEQTEIKQQFMDMFSKLEVLLSQITEKQDTGKIAPKILLLLQQWSDLDKKSGMEKGIEQVLATEDEETSSGKIVRELIQTFQKREQLVTKQQYHTAAAVTTKDVSKWVQKALENQSQSDQVAKQQVHTTGSLPISKLEQFVIHINENQSLPANKQLLEQFQTVLKSSAFQTKPNGINQLSITLKPHNLGEMMVRLTEIDGEMTVKIIVNSHAAKKMLESNMHQLRSMFSPQQVVIEKQELTLQQGQDLEREQKDQQLKDQEQSQSDQSSQNQREQTNTGDDFAAQFHEMLMNEKV